jgi:hypothetical protein
MAALVGLTLIKQFTYRGDATEEWSNKYHFTGSIPADSTAWKALADALIAVEKLCYSSDSRVIRAYGYDSDDASPSAVWSWDYLAHGTALTGTAANTLGVKPAGDQAAVVWWKTDRLNTRGRPIYLRKYMHSVWIKSTDADSPSATNGTALDGFANKLADGTFLDARTLRSRTHADAIIAQGHDQFITTRTLKRRGKRP